MPIPHSLAETCDTAIECLLYFLLIFATLAYGSVQILPLSVIESSIFIVFSVWLIKASFSSQPLIKPSFRKPALAFILLVFFQISPFPRPVVSFLSGQRVALLDKFFPSQLARLQYIPLSISQSQTLLKFIELLSYAVIFFVLVQTLENRGQFKRLIAVITFTGLITAVLEMANNFRFPFVNRNHFAGNMEMVIPLAIGYILSGAERTQKVIFGFAALIMVTALFLSLSRAGSLCFLSSIVFMALMLRLRRGLRGRLSFVYILIAGSFLLILAMGIEPLLERFGALFKHEIFSRESRFQIWTDTLKIARDFPIFGTGLGTFRNIYPVYKTLPEQARVLYAHSDFLQLISETGIAGLFLAAWFLFLFSREVSLAWLKRHDPFVKGIALGGLSAILAVLLHGFFDFNLQIPANALMFTVIMAVTYKCIALQPGVEI